MISPGAKHDLVVGGTGMLRGVVEHLLAEGSQVTVMARSRRAFGGLERSVQANAGALSCIAVDYTDDRGFATALGEAFEQRGSPLRAVAWIHDSTAPASLGILTHTLAGAQRPTMLWEVVGSVDDSPDAIAAQRRKRSRVGFLDHRQVVLGYAPGPPWRWLTDGEISEGIIAALNDDRASTTVGVTEPWPPTGPTPIVIG